MKNAYSEQIVKHCKLVDHRLEKRFGKVVDALLDNFGASIPQSVVKRSQVKAAYNFFSHKAIDEAMLLATERERLLSQLLQERPKIVLSIQDSTDVVYTDSRADAALGCLQYEYMKGFYIHNHMIYNVNGMGLGVFDQKFWNYRAEELGTHKDQRKKVDFEDKASFRWYEQFEGLQKSFENLPDTTVISIADREGDIHELLQARRLANVHYIIRGRGDRNEDLTKVNVKERLREQPIVQRYEIEVPRNDKDKNNRIPKRTAQVGLSYKTLTINASYRRKDCLYPIAPLELTVVYVNEINPPKDVKEPIEWVLYTSLAVNSVEEALLIVHYYKMRWLIEIFHFVLKQGAKVEDLQLKTPHALQNALVTYSIIALQVQNLRYATQEYGQQPIEEVDYLDVTAQDYGLLATYLNTTNQTEHQVDKIKPTVEDFFKLIAQLGGFQFQKNRVPGVKILWRGWQKWLIIKKVALILRI